MKRVILAASMRAWEGCHSGAAMSVSLLFACGETSMLKGSGAGKPQSHSGYSCYIYPGCRPSRLQESHKTETAQCKNPSPSLQQQKEDTVRSIEVTIRLALVAGLIVWCFEIVRPFLSTIIWALIIASALFPLFNWFKNKINKGPGLSSALFTIAILAAILTPSFMLSGTLITTAKEYAEELEDGSLQVPPAPEKVKEWPVVGERVYSAWELANENPGAALEKFESQLREAARWLLRTAAGAGLGILQFAAAVVVAGVFLAYNEGGGAFARGWEGGWPGPTERISPPWPHPPFAASPRACWG